MVHPLSQAYGYDIHVFRNVLLFVHRHPAIIPLLRNPSCSVVEYCPKHLPSCGRLFYGGVSLPFDFFVTYLEKASVNLPTGVSPLLPLVHFS